MAIAKDKMIISRYDHEQIYVYDSSGELKYSFPTKELDVDLLSISDKNEIIAAQYLGKFVYIYTKEGNEKEKFEVPKHHDVLDLVFNHVTKEVIVLTCNNYFKSMFTNQDLECWISSYSRTGDKRQTVRSPLLHHYILDTDKLITLPLIPFLTSHPSGPVALVHGKTVLYIQ